MQSVQKYVGKTKPLQVKHFGENLYLLQMKKQYKDKYIYWYMYFWSEAAIHKYSHLFGKTLQNSQGRTYDEVSLFFKFAGQGLQLK